MKTTNINYIVGDRHTGTTIEECETMEQAIAIIKKFEDEDKKEGIGGVDFYAILDVKADEWI